MSGSDSGGVVGPGTGSGSGRVPGPGAGPGDSGAVDPDVDLHVPAQRAETGGRHGLVVLAAVAVGGALGALARYALSLWLPDGGGAGFPWGIFVVNLLGCALIGVLMPLISEGGRDARTHPLVRPFLGVGVLGGFTTFSTYAVDAANLLQAGPHAVPVAVAYLGGTLVGALGAVWAGAAATRALLGRGSGTGEERGTR